MLRTFIQVLSLTTVLISSIFLIRGTITLSKKDLAELSTARWNYNLDVAKNLCHQRADYIVGSALLLFSFFLQMGNMLWEIRLCDFAINKIGVVLALVVAGLIYLTANVISNKLYSNQYAQVENILRNQ